MSVPSAALQRLRLRTELRKARQTANLTQREVAAAMEWSSAKLIRIEAGEVGISVNDLRSLLAFYGIDDRQRIDELLALARSSRKMPFTEYRDLYDKDFLQFLALEQAAWITRQYGPLVIPGTLQTEEYMRAVMRAFDPHATEEVIDRAVEGRTARQEVLEDTEGRGFFYVLDESVLRRVCGGNSVMRKQLEHIADLSTRPNITIKILPFSSGAHPGILGPFTVFEFQAEEMENALFVEDSRGNTFAVNSAEETRRYLERFWELEDLSVDGDVETLLRRLAVRMEEGGDDLAKLLKEDAD
ncbi:helix-turn-helix domain-containing protein [Streptomyces coeruleorubidus]|uniref:Helix-turn-helix transcriptional regulator n=1 Tax=Streptomyces coeruleorubidus TaxID=116188 RepID=A0ABZ0KGV7_STRC4|nr:helix-turn-helix transcriptional regulator [Streptomyces coeruleorubidus]WOT37009.1 helix-turn-helix transcriptional regulator [Streptomyces coeruleorubidus]